MLPKLNRKRALFVLTKIDEILAWERRSEAERDTRFVELGRYLCEVRAGQYWRLEKWRVGEIGGHPKVVDVIAEGTSLRLTQRSEYCSVIGRNNGAVSALLVAMKRQIQQLAAREQASR